MIKGLIGGLKGIGGRLGRAIVFETYLETHHDFLIAAFKAALGHIRPADVPSYVQGNMALPIPEEAFRQMSGLEDCLERIEPHRIAEWINEARPEIFLALAELGDEGAEYIVRFKQFIIASVKAAGKQPEEGEKEEATPPDESKEATPSSQKSQVEPPHSFRVNCDECNESWMVTQEELADLKTCPFCDAPSNINK